MFPQTIKNFFLYSRKSPDCGNCSSGYSGDCFAFNSVKNQPVEATGTIKFKRIKIRGQLEVANFLNIFFEIKYFQIFDKRFDITIRNRMMRLTHLVRYLYK